MKMGRPSKSTTAIGLLLWLALVLELVQGQQGGPSPALYMFGDSQLDVGNNNYVLTSQLLFKANHPRYGVDYPGGVATGRFSNGRNLADFIAASLGVATSPPAYRSISNDTGNSSIFLKGVNFAYGGAGVSDLRDENHRSYDFILFGRNGLREQIERDYSSVHAQLVRQLGQTEASAHLANSIFVIAVGGTDIVERFLLDPAYRERIRSDQEYQQYVARSLAAAFNAHLSLYQMGMRKVFVVGTGPLGCYPAVRLPQSSDTTPCRDEVNSLSAQYNAAVVDRLRRAAAGSSELRYSFFDQYAVLQRYLQEPEANGYGDVKEACCEVTDAAPVCNSMSSLCPNRTDHMFWDGVHLTEITTQKLMAIAFDGSAPVVSPVNLKELSAP
ncbi:hypothetical protein BDA96_01G191500 [Sorghum bicolor]|uniref:GDSL esterase/lipase n=1 Tax=Sorghum bicolor TaxID=4558 RepID=A0A921RYE3_SORBI|nr:hypothetical protein BDA96_01G191500 [Sorghum bicolor]